MGTEKRRTLLGSERYIAVLFLVSGFSALIYQVVWQRVLFATFGINSEAVTVIVSVFMFGLGVGALLGGQLQKRFPQRLLAIFIGLEILIGLFGLVSLPLIQFVSHLSSSGSTLELVGWSYLILAIPTLLMGATLPVLVSFL
jgi:predicted membrane-bound spermidine synthase